MRFIISLFKMVTKIVLFIWEMMSIWSVDIGYHYLWWMVVNIVHLWCLGKFPILISARFNKTTYSLQGNRIQSKWIFKRIYITLYRSFFSLFHQFIQLFRIPFYLSEGREPGYNWLRDHSWTIWISWLKVIRVSLWAHFGILLFGYDTPVHSIKTNFALNVKIIQNISLYWGKHCRNSIDQSSDVMSLRFCVFCNLNLVLLLYLTLYF